MPEPEPVLVRRRVVVTGRVQGVFFRDSTARQARRHAVAGWVANRPDGSVEAVFEGKRDAVAALVDWMREGPEHAWVASHTVSEEEPAGERGFRVR
ncbi:MAG: acylphosphatase [Friedmanniella sp.]